MYITDCTLCILLIVPCVHYRLYLVYITDRTLCILQVVHIDLTTDEMARVTHIVVVVPTSENDDKVSLTLRVHCMTLRVHCMALRVHCMTLRVHCMTLRVHCMTLLVHCMTLCARIHMTLFLTDVTNVHRERT